MIGCSELWEDMTGDKLPLTWCTDCMSLWETLHADQSKMIREPRYQRDVDSLRQDLRRELFDMVWCPSRQNLADALTKAMPPKDLRTVIERAIVPESFKDPNNLC